MSAQMTAAVGVKDVIKNFKDGVDSMDKALRFFNRELDEVVPWKAYKQTVKDLDLHSTSYSNESAQLVGEVVTLMANAQDSYSSASQNIHEWCGLSTKLLVTFVDLFVKEMTAATYQAQKNFFITVLNGSLTKMSAAQVKLDQTHANFKDVAGKLEALHERFTNDFDEKSSFFQSKVEKIRMDASKSKTTADVEPKLIPELRRKLAETVNFIVGFKASIDRSHVNVAGMKAKLELEVKTLETVKVHVEATETVIPVKDLDELRHIVIQPVYNLIAQCNEYRKRHGQD